jgi:hypothetical protein
VSVIAPGASFPRQELRDLDGQSWPIEQAWSQGPALLLVGHRNCKTTRQTIPYVDRIHRRKRPSATALVVLQDDAETARALAAELGIEVPVRLEGDPYPLAAALSLETVPTLFLVEGGRIEKVSEAFNRADIEEAAARLGVAGALFTPEDKAPAFKPG